MYSRRLKLIDLDRYDLRFDGNLKEFRGNRVDDLVLAVSFMAVRGSKSDLLAA